MNDYLQQLMTNDNIELKYRQLKRQVGGNNQAQQQIDYYYRALIDPYYAAMLYKGEEDYLQVAGFFDDRLSKRPDWQLDLLTTPFEKACRNKRPDKQSVVLLTTGAFSPLHQGHLQMMLAAKEAIEAEGKNVIAAYLAPDHDDYVSSKDNNMLPIAERIEICHHACLGSNWLETDPWPGYYAPTAINFTDALDRLSAYLKKHVTDDIEVRYVFGSDNKQFQRAFSKQGQCVCVSRGEKVKKTKVIDNQRILLVEHNHSSRYASSSAIRQGDERFTLGVKEKQNRQEKQVYALRNDLAWASQLAGNQSNSISKTSIVNITEKIKNIFNEYLSMQTELIDVERQNQFLNDLGQYEKILNIDQVTRRGCHLDIGRQFSIADGQIRGQQLIARPGSESLEAQMRTIPQGKYILIDDDISSGYTMERIKQMLPVEIEIKKQISLLHTVHEHVFDVCDLRDFILGLKDSGLIVSLPDGQQVRVPYMLPYVNTHSRILIPVQYEKELSKRLWQINEEYHKESLMNVGDADLACRKLLHYIGWQDVDSLEAVSRWHRWQLTK